MKPSLSISNDSLEVSFDEVTSALKVTDKRCGKTWEQLPLAESLTVTNVLQEQGIIRLKVSGALSFEASIELTDPAELNVAIFADPDAKFEKCAFPSAFKTPDATHYLLQTDGAGMLLPADDTAYPLGENLFYTCGGGACMSWMGVIDGDFQTGYMAIFETPFDAAIETKRVGGLVTFAPVWLGSMERFSYARKIKYVFFDGGGYVAQAKKYREYIWPKNSVKTLRESQDRIPAIEKMLGAVHIYVWDKAREVSFAQSLKKDGVEKALFLWDPNHHPYPEDGYDDRLKELGYGAGAYELFSDIHRDTSSNNASLAELPLKRNIFPGLFEKVVARKKDGSTYSNQFGTYNCPAGIREEISKRVDRELVSYPHETYFVDVYLANGLYECYEPNHPRTREQYARSISENLAIFQDKYHLYVGGEWGADFAGSQSVFVHGMMTLQRTWFHSAINDKGTVFYLGDWKNNARPSIMLGTRVAPDVYLQYSINESTRVPLYELVYHDAIVTSWRWEDCNHHTPAIWWKKDLFNILYGTIPLWSLDQDRWEEFKTTFLESYRNICPWLQQICYDEMVSHRFVSPDRAVQEAAFSSGKKVVVNFGAATYVYENKIIPPRGFVIC